MLESTRRVTLFGELNFITLEAPAPHSNDLNRELKPLQVQQTATEIETLSVAVCNKRVLHPLLVSLHYITIKHFGNAVQSSAIELKRTRVASNHD